MDIAVVGSNMVDLISYIHRMPSDGETVEAPEFRMGCGGKGANQAVAASRLGAEVVMVTRVGNDVFADTTLDNFRKKRYRYYPCVAYRCELRGGTDLRRSRIA